MMSARRWVIALAMVCLAVALLPAPAGAKAHPQWRGVDAAPFGWESRPEADSIRDVHEAAALGADTIRLVLRWDWLAPSRARSYPASRLSRVKRLLRVARSEHLRVVATVLSTPTWASGQANLLGLSFAAPPRDAADFGDFVGDISQRWGRLLAAIEVWNEPNLTFFWRGSAAQYVGLVRAARIAVDDSRNPDLRVVGGALAGSAAPYLQRLYDRGIANWSDAISIHPYDSGDPARRRPGDLRSFTVGIPKVHRTMRANRDRDPLMITEFGVSDCGGLVVCALPAVKAARLEYALRRAAQWRYLDAVLLYRLRDSSDASRAVDRFGVLNSDWTVKPAAGTVRRAFTSLPRVRPRP